jgi:hypothetical protein
MNRFGNQSLTRRSSRSTGNSISSRISACCFMGRTSMTPGVLSKYVYLRSSEHIAASTYSTLTFSRANLRLGTLPLDGCAATSKPTTNLPSARRTNSRKAVSNGWSITSNREMVASSARGRLSGWPAAAYVQAAINRHPNNILLATNMLQVSPRFALCADHQTLSLMSPCPRSWNGPG